MFGKSQKTAAMTAVTSGAAAAASAAAIGQEQSDSRFRSERMRFRRAAAVGEEEKANRQTRWRARWEDSKGMLLVLCSETFGTGMAASARLLEIGDGGMTTLQIMFMRFSMTFALSCLYSWYVGIADFPFGKREVRWLLVLRGVGGTVAVSSFYYSLEYLSVAEAILIGFTCPILTAYSCSIFLHAPFDKKQLAAGIISFFGVILIAQPGPLSRLPGSHTQTDMPEGTSATPAQRLLAVIAGLVGALGGTCAYTTIRVIGTRVHPLISVNYYAVFSTCFSGAVLLLPIFPDVNFRLPHGGREWGLLIGLGVLGFFLQFFMTTGLVKDQSSRATNMMYSSVLFGLIADFVIWGVVPGWLSWVGGAIVTAATVWGSMQKGDTRVRKVEGPAGDEEYAMVPGDEILVSSDDDEQEDVDGDGDRDQDDNDQRGKPDLEGLHKDTK